MQYAELGVDNSLWVALVEKAYALHRGNEETYASLHGGFSSTVFDTIGASAEVSRSFTNSSQALRHIETELNAGKAVVVNINSPEAGCPCLGNHAYIVERVNYATQTFWGHTFEVPVSVVLRNPWGIDGTGQDGNNDGLVTVTGEQLVKSMYSGDFGIQSATIA